MTDGSRRHRPPRTPQTQEREAKKTAKQEEKSARDARKAIGDGIKEGLRLPAEPGSLTFVELSPPVIDLIFKDARPNASSTGTFELTKGQLVAVFGTTKIEKGGSRDQRYDCERARFTYDAAASTLRVEYHPKAMGSNIWWKNR